jgi:hypothetical protein
MDMSKKFTVQSVTLSIANVSSFDSNSLTYIDFLDCLVRVANIYPFPEENKMSPMDEKL